jgi:hypothetical protein
VRITLAAIAMLSVTPAWGHWECYPVRLAPAVHHMLPLTHKPSIRHHHHHKRTCHVHKHCIWVSDDVGGPAGFGSGGGDWLPSWLGEGGEGYAGGYDGEAELLPDVQAGREPSREDLSWTTAEPVGSPLTPIYVMEPCFPPITYPVAPAPIPELPTWQLMVLGFAVVALSAKLKRMI